MQVKLSAANMWVTIFIEIMQLGVSVAMMQVVFFAVHYAHEYFYCTYAGGYFRCSHVCDSFSNFIFLSLTSIFHKIDQKAFKVIATSLHFTTLVNILSKLRYFVGRIYIQMVKRVIQYFCFLDRPIKHQDILHFQKGGNLREGGVDLEKREGYDPLTNYTLIEFSMYQIS